MPIRKMTAKERNQLFGDGLVLPVRKPKRQPKGSGKADEAEFPFLQFNTEHGQGFSATLMDGPSIDLFEIAGLEWTADLHDDVWGHHNWKSLLEECRTAEIIETGSQDHTPGMSDVFFWVVITDPKKFRQELRAAILYPSGQPILTTGAALRL